MGKNGPAFYDDEVVFTTYTSRRETRVDSPNETLEKPIFEELVGELTDLHILDLGCGSAGFGLEALNHGCRSYLGIDGSHKMVEAAREKLADTPGKVVCASIESWDYPSHQFDVVTSRLALHYVLEIEIVFAKVYQALIGGGRFIFSVEHPVITSCDRAWQIDGPRQDWIVDDYFETGPRVTTWMGGEVIKYHHTIEDYFIALRGAGFVVEALRESRPQRAHFHEEATFERRKRIPLMLFFAAYRPLQSGPGNSRQFVGEAAHFGINIYRTSGYVAFLRAINVGHGHTLKMESLRQVFETLGFSEVKTFMSSGNVIFETTPASKKSLERMIKNKLKEAFGYEVATFIRTDKELAKFASYKPFSQSKVSSISELNIIFLAQPLDATVCLTHVSHA